MLNVQKMSPECVIIYGTFLHNLRPTGARMKRTSYTTYITQNFS